MAARIERGVMAGRRRYDVAAPDGDAGWALTDASARSALGCSELLEEPIADLTPRAHGSGILAVLLESIAHEPPMPIRHRNPLVLLRDATPQRLDVPNLLVGRQVVKARGRHRQRTTHVGHATGKPMGQPSGDGCRRGSVPAIPRIAHRGIRGATLSTSEYSTTTLVLLVSIFGGSR